MDVRIPGRNSIVCPNKFDPPKMAWGVYNSSKHYMSHMRQELSHILRIHIYIYIINIHNIYTLPCVHFPKNISPTQSMQAPRKY